MAQQDTLNTIQKKVWEGRLPLEIKLSPSECRTFDEAEPYLATFPRLSYLPDLLPRLLEYFSHQMIEDSASIKAETGYLTHDEIPLKWHFPMGLLYDIHVLATQDMHSEREAQSVLPFRLTVHFSTNHLPSNLIRPSPLVVHDSFINSVKEADFLRSGTAKPIMSLSALDSKALWSATQENDLATFARIYNDLFPPPGQVRNIPFRIFLPSSPNGDPKSAQIKVLQSQTSPVVTAAASSAVKARNASSTPQTLGTALHNLTPSLFPSRRTPILAKPLLHGAAISMNAPLEDLARKACYADGWINIVVAMTSH